MGGLASIIIVTYNSCKYIENCIKSIVEQDYPHEIIIVDNNSMDQTADFVRSKFPDVKLLENKENKGYGAGNNVGARHAKGEILVILNPDTIVERNWLGELVKPLSKAKKLLTTPKILIYDGSSINTCGNINHFTGLTFTRGLGEKPDAYPNEEFVSGISGCCFAIRRKEFEELGGFDERFFMYMEDSDLSWRAHLNDFKILYTPKSVVRHNYTLKVSPEKIFHLEVGRHMILRKYLSANERLKMAPSLLMAEVLALGYSITLGMPGIKNKIKAGKYARKLKIEHIEGDARALFRALSPKIPLDQLNHTIIDRAVKRIANFIFGLNCEAIK